jgi:hypothetical protein
VTIKHIVSLSGGIGSYETLKRVIAKEGKENIIAVFCDTMNEDGDLYRFLSDIENHLGIVITRLATGKDPWQLCFENKFLFNSRVALCSRILKTQLFNDWLRENFAPNDCVLYLGIDFTESHRKEAIVKGYAPYKVEFPMCDKPYIYKYEMIDELKNEGIKIPRLYELGFAHNNCGGACFKAGIASWKNLLEKDRIKFLECEDKEEVFRKRSGKDVSILKRSGKPFTLRQLREAVDSAPEQLSLFDDEEVGGCGCFVGDFDNENNKGENDEKGKQGT